MTDLVMLAILNGRLVQIADEMDATLYRSAFNPIIAEAHDACHGIYHAQTGATLVQGTSGLPIFVGAMAFAVKAVIDKVARDGDLAEGDTYIFNDPYDGGTHLNDFRLVRPLMRAGQVFAWIASVGHWLDVGGNVPGNFNATATESFQEGFRVPPVKLVRAGMLQHDIVEILAANSRVPQSNWGDLNGQLNALDLGERRLHALLDEYGDDTIRAALDALTRRAETLMRANIAALPDGTYSYDDFLDNDGITDAPLRIALDLTIAGDSLRLDLSRSSAPCAGPLNIARSTTIACCYVALKHLFTDVPANAGCLAPVAFVVPDTTLLGVSAPKPVGGYTETILRVIDVIFGAFAKVAPERAQGSPFATINALSLAGWRAHGRRWVMFCFFGGGLGGNPEGDGLNHANNPISTAVIPPVEILESLYPIMFTQWALRPDSGGPGRHRGGLGAIYEIEALDERGAEVFLLGERGKYPPFGANGGREAALNRFVYQTDAGERTPPLVAKITDVRIACGQKVRLETPGGGGFGDPVTRDPERVARDVRLGYVSPRSARDDYKVVLRRDGAPDIAATAALRAGSGGSAGGSAA
jgi:N-methylhydantoinase B